MNSARMRKFDEVSDMAWLGLYFQALLSRNAESHSLTTHHFVLNRIWDIELL